MTIDLPKRYLEKADCLGVDLDDVQEAFIRGSGKGGQKINKTASCVWLRHLPTRLEVKVQKHREQIPPDWFFQTTYPFEDTVANWARI